MDRKLHGVRYGGCETRDVNEMPDQAQKDEHDAKEAEERWDDPEWVEELFGLWDRRLLQTDPAQADNLPEHRRVWWTWPMPSSMASIAGPPKRWPSSRHLVSAHRVALLGA